MASEIKANKISPATGTAFTLGDSGDIFTIPSGVTLTNNGSSSGFDSGLASVQTFTSSGTWTKPSGITKVMVEVQGGGGSGNESDNTARDYCAGGAGGYAKKLIDVSSISTATITVGSGGAGINNVVNGNAGGDSVWSDGTNTVTGGGGGASSASGSSGGTASGGDLNINGSGSSTMYQDYPGTASFLGACLANNNFTGYGYGSAPTQTTTLDGGDGIVIVTEYK